MEIYGDMVQIQQNKYRNIWFFIGCNGKLIGILFKRQ